MNNKKIIIGLIFSILGFLYILVVTNINNLGASSDSVTYIEASRNITNGNELKDSYTLIWPPLYPITLSYISLILGIDSIYASKFLSAFLLFATIFVFNLIIIKFKATNFTIFLLNFLMITSSAMSVFLMIWSEPLFILLLLLLSYFFIAWIESNNKLLLYISGILSGLLILTRYAGIGFVAGVIFFLLLKKESLKVKLINLISFLLISAGIAGSWIMFSSSQSNPLNKDIAFHLVTKSHLTQIKTTLINWVIPSFTKLGIIFILLIFILIVFDIWRRKINIQFKNINIETKFFILLLISYLGFLLSFITFISNIYLDNRILSPIYPIMIILLIPLIEKIQKLKNERFLYYAPIIFILISCSYSFFIRSKNFYFKGEGYSNKLWIESETINNLRNYHNVSIFSNGVPLLRLLYNSENLVYHIPPLIDGKTNTENIEFPKQMEAMKDSIEARKSILVFFDSTDWKNIYPKEALIKSELRSFNFDELNDGFILYKKIPTSGIK